MATENTRPTTLAGIKRLAQLIKKTQGKPHSDALEIAAGRAGFQNLRHAQNVLGKPSPELHRAYVTFYWMESKQGEACNLGDTGPFLAAGCTTMEIRLPVPLKDLLPGSTLDRTPYLGAQFRLESPDHLELRRDCFSERAGLGLAELAGRVLNFMAATGLRPLLANEMDRPTQRVELSKMADHCSTWFDGDSNSIVIVDEPYTIEISEAIAWASDHDFHTVDVRWRGLYMTKRPPLLHSFSEAAITRLAGNLEALETRFQGEAWPYTRQAYDRQFMSPARIASGKRKAVRAMPSPEGVVRAGALPWRSEPGYRSSWRPARRMDLKKHLHIGPIIHSIASTTLRTDIGLIASDLANWFFCEYSGAEVPDEDDRYAYDTKLPNFCPGSESLLANLAVVRQTIVEGYEDCKPKREMLVRIDKAATLMSRRLSRKR